MKILIVDDEYVEIEALTYILENSPFSFEAILTASNGRQAIESAKKHRPDIVLMDIKMPGISGTEAAATIKEFHPDCKLVFLSAYNYFNYAQEAIRLRASDFLIKPIASDDLFHLLNRLIGEFDHEKNSRQISTTIESQFRQIASFFENELINYVLFADVKQKQLEEYFHALNCSPNQMHAIVAVIDDALMEDYSSLKYNMVMGRSIKTFKNLIAPSANNCFGNFNKNWLYLLAETDHSLSKEAATTMAQTLQKTMTDKLGLTCRIAISPATGDIMSLNHKILASKHALVFNPNKPIIIFPAPIQTSDQRFSSTKENMLLEAIRLNNTPMILTLSSEFCQWLKDSGHALAKMKYSLIGFLSYLIKSHKGDSIAQNNRLESLLDHYTQRVETAENPDTLTACFTDQLLTMAQILMPDAPSGDSPVVKRICDAIDHHYAEDLNLTTLANRLNMNSQYLSKLFKTEKGITFSDYLTNVRISKAKKLLVDTNDTIQVIGLSVGYNDPNYFTRAFKKHEALTPKQYRAKASMF